MTAAVAARRPRYVVPPGWASIPVAADNRDTAREVFTEAWRRGPRDSIGPFIHRLEEWLVDVLDDARDADCFAVVLPLGVPWQVPVSTAIALSLVPTATGALPVLPPGGEARETDAGPARRVVTDVPTDGADPESLALLRTIEYTWLAPDGGLLVGFASISGQPVAEFAPVTDALSLLVETMLEALDWPTASEEPA
ncbi:hypothetical protein [uncultured Microbacterium sp.]|uniref:hypothetical protein n=1 Tax=uncultured Microbacterium sp. TaxID=191216 RepID=UPI00261FDBF7|nr:hypothetical protein [uncultured Microbacterium sp.]